MLLVFLPGHYLQLLDIGSDHDACHNLTFLGPESATLLPHQTDPAVADYPVYLTHCESFRNLPDGYGAHHRLGQKRKKKFFCF